MESNISHKRPEWTDEYIEESLEHIRRMIKFRREQKGDGIYMSSHEILGILTEEMGELQEAVHDNNAIQVYNELLDIAVGAIFAMTSVGTNEMDWI